VFIDAHKDLVNWYHISHYQKLSEVFIDAHKNLVNWYHISRYQKLSEVFIDAHKDLVNWDNISTFQKLSEDFIETHKDFVNWRYISTYQKLSEVFIEANKDLVIWGYISTYQKLSEGFIEAHKDLVNWCYISSYQELSEDFIKAHNLVITSNNWLYTSSDEKLAAIKASGLYKIEGDYVIAYKGIRSDRYSNFNFQYQYFVGETYESHADYNIDNDSSFGLSAWTLDKAKEYCNELIIKVKIHKDDLAALVHDGHKIRCSKFTVLCDVD
jgi:hypothetical protein